MATRGHQKPIYLEPFQLRQVQRPISQENIRRQSTCSFIQALFTWYLQVMPCRKHICPARTTGFHRESDVDKVLLQPELSALTQFMYTVKLYTGNIKVGKWKRDLLLRYVKKTSLWVQNKLQNAILQFARNSNIKNKTFRDLKVIGQVTQKHSDKNKTVAGALQVKGYMTGVCTKKISNNLLWLSYPWFKNKCEAFNDSHTKDLCGRLYWGLQMKKKKKSFCLAAKIM